jgi:type IX secretion system PorP/SprF family membrane protein
LAGNFVTNTYYYNQYIQKIRGGIGAYSIYDNAGDGTLKSLLFSLVYAAHIEIKNIVIQPAFEAEYRTRHLDWDKLTFGDLIDPRYGFASPPPSAVKPSSTQSFFDCGTGLLCYTKRLYAGFSIAHLMEPEESFTVPRSGSTLPMKFSYNAGAIFHSGDSDLWSFNPDIIYLKQRDFEEWLVTMSVKYTCWKAGLGVRKGDAVILFFGVQPGRLSASYSYDITTSSLGSTAGGSHELALSYRIINKTKPVKKISLNTIAF